VLGRAHRDRLDKIDHRAEALMVPAVLLTVLRFMPTRMLERMGLVEELV
jgi:hypothetical protein